MKLWILEPVENLSDGDNPWNRFYGRTFGFVVRADTEEEAREFAHENAGDENTSIIATGAPWKYSEYSTCKELVADGEPGMIMRDFVSG